MLSDKEIIELERLLKEQSISDRHKSLTNINEKTPLNYKFIYESFISQKYQGDKLISGYKGVILEGGARSRKTYSVVDFIVWYCTKFANNKTIIIIRETYNSFKTTLFTDFEKSLSEFGLDNPFERSKDVESIRIRKNKIHFKGADNPNAVHGAPSDILYFNEMLSIPKAIYSNYTMRCDGFFIGDFNPSVTEHWVFNEVITRPDIGYLRTTFKDNPLCPIGMKIEIMGYEPWLPGSYEIVDNSTLYYDGNPIDDKNQPPPHPDNLENGTADVFLWTVYGLGLRGAMKGIIFIKVAYIDSFPDMAYTYGLDFGFTTDPTALVRHAEDDANIWLELLCYQPIDNPEELSEFMDTIGIERHLPITADSSDKYTSNNKGTVEMVISLQNIGWEIAKVSKTKSIMYWLGTMKKKKIHIVRNHLYKFAKKEQENYRFKEINGIVINQPIDDHNHCFVGNTVIMTDKGNMRIDEIKSGDFIATENGYNKVVETWNNGYKPINNYLLDFGMFTVNLTCTQSHLIKTSRGWIEIKEVKSTDQIYLHKSLMGKYLGFTQEKNIFQEEIKECMSMFGNMKIKKMYLLNIMSIILTAILSIIQLKILRLKMQTNIYLHILKSILLKIQNGLSYSLKKELKAQKNGMLPQMVLNGINNMQQNLDLEKKYTGIGNVIYATKNILPDVPLQSSVQTIVNQKIEEKVKLTQLNLNVQYVKISLKKISTLNQKHATNSVEQVYDLAVENDHSYFANGILVHNCWDASRYAHMAYNSNVELTSYWS